MRRLFSVAPVLLWLITPLAFAQLPGITSQPLPGGGQSWSLPVQTLVFITSLTFIPAILLMMTSFTRIIIVFGLLRNALGTPSAPPNQVLLGLALFLTFSHLLVLMQTLTVLIGSLVMVKAKEPKFGRCQQNMTLTMSMLL